MRGGIKRVVMGRSSEEVLSALSDPKKLKKAFTEGRISFIGCSSPEGIFQKFHDKFKIRKTVPKKESVKAIHDIILSLQIQPHYPGCYLPGQIPPKLSKEDQKENEFIEILNSRLKEVAQLIK